MPLNVRLTPKDESLVRSLRRAKVNVSALVRRAIREAAEGTAKQRNHKRSATVKEALALFPAPPGFRPRHPELTDRKAIGDFVRQRLARK